MSMKKYIVEFLLYLVACRFCLCACSVDYLSFPSSPSLTAHRCRRGEVGASGPADKREGEKRISLSLGLQEHYHRDQTFPLQEG